MVCTILLKPSLSNIPTVMQLLIPDWQYNPIFHNCAINNRINYDLEELPDKINRKLTRYKGTAHKGNANVVKGYI